MKIRIRPREDTSLEATIMREVFQPQTEEYLKNLLIQAADRLYALGSTVGEMDDIIMRLETRLIEQERNQNGN